MRDHFDWATVYPKGVGRTLPVPDVTLGSLLAAAARDGGERVALTLPDGDISFRALHERACTVAQQLSLIAPHTGERLLVQLANGWEFAAAAFGAYHAGWSVVPVTPEAPEALLREIVGDVRPAALLGAHDERLALERVASGAAVIRVRAEPRACPAEPGAAVGASDAAVLQYTSGTTGGRKAAVMTHRNLVANALQNNEWFGWTADDVILGVLPFCHTWGLSCVLHAGVAARARIVCLPRFDAQDVLDAIESERVTVAYGSATMWHRLLDAAGTSAAQRFRTLRFVKAGAMLVGGGLTARWSAAVPNVPMILGYGLTEASPEVCNNPLGAARDGTVGVPLPGTELRICDPEHPQHEVGDEGELQVRGPQVMAGYWERPDATSAALTQDGWLRTGDLARFDDAGYVRIVDRLKDLIKFRGYSVIPGEIEAALRTHPRVLDAVVVGAVDAVDGEVPTAYIQTDDPTLDAAELAAHVEPLLASHARPRRYEMIDEIPRNHVGKPLRRVLRDRASAGS